MDAETVQEAENDRLFSTSQGGVLNFGFEVREIDSYAFKLWRHGQSFNLMADECQCCKGAAQECLVTCP